MLLTKFLLLNQPMAIYFHLFAFSIAKLTLATVLNFLLAVRAASLVYDAKARFIDFNLRLRSNYNYFEASSSLRAEANN